MMLLRTTFVLVALVGLCAANWELYKNVHGKSYARQEDQLRRGIFEETVQRISEHNLRHDLGATTYRMGLNQFSDMTNDEYRMYKGLRFNASRILRGLRPVFTGEHVKDLPESIDWRTKGYVTPVKDQKRCGSCWSFSATGAVEGQHFRKTGELVSLSEQQLVDCSADFDNHGCNGGLMDNAFQYIKVAGGLDSEESYPYTASEHKCHMKRDSIAAKVSGFVDVAQGDEEALKKAVGVVGPVSVAIDAGHPSFQSYKSGVYDEPECSSVQLDHGVLVVGYGNENNQDYWLVKNSWNTVWGEEGFVKMARNKDNQCGIASSASYPTV